MGFLLHFFGSLYTLRILAGGFKMAYDEALAGRIREILGKSRGVTEKKMFGGLCFLLNGSMIGGVLKDQLVVKIGRQAHEKLGNPRHVRPFDFTGKPMMGIVYVAPQGLKSRKDLAKWLELGKNQAQNTALSKRSASKGKSKKK